MRNTIVNRSCEAAEIFIQLASLTPEPRWGGLRTINTNNSDCRHCKSQVAHVHSKTYLKSVANFCEHGNKFSGFTKVSLYIYLLKWLCVPFTSILTLLHYQFVLYYDLPRILTTYSRFSSIRTVYRFSSASLFTNIYRF